MKRTIKTVFASLFGLTLLGTGLLSRAQVAAKPDLRILQVAEYNTTARVRVVNQGAAPSGLCRLYAYGKAATGAWVYLGQVTVPAMAPGTATWVSLTANGVQWAPTMYAVDATNIVAESNEFNNRIIIP
jgi:hypothetical protein